MSDKVQLDELDDLFRFRQRDVSDSFQSGAKLFGKRRQGPVRLFLLWVAGPKRSILRLVPSEETWFIVIGTLILITTIIAGLGAFATASYIMHGRLQADTAAIVFGLFWAIIIFFFDRALVRMPMNPVIFSPAAMDIVWGENSAKPSALENAVIRRWHDGLRVLATTLPRFVVAVAAAVIFAETLLFVYFEEDLQPVVKHISSERYKVEREREQDKIRNEIADIDGRIRLWKEAHLPDLAVLESSIEKLKVDQRNLEVDERTLGDAIDAEESGRRGSFKVSFQEEPIETSGLKGLQGRSIALLDLQADVRQWITDKTTQITETVGKAAALEAEETKRPNSELKALKDSKASLEIPKEPSEVKGIGVRMDALDRYEHDMVVSTPDSVDKALDCPEGVSGIIFCAAPRFFVQPTPQGPIFAGIRWGLIFIELAPIFAKFAFVLRRRRPYDTLVAAQELIANGASVRLVGEQLARTGAVLEVCGSHNQAIRTAAGADLYLVNANVTSQRRPSWFDRLRKESPWGFGGSWHLMKKADELEDLSPSVEGASKGGVDKPRR
ncbi:MAG: DUF4407 domain-containing protein [Propionibacteriaceae bacterium]|nr:DUF4407 domain-containing protein [Propionibacteriaceae bacterium]